MAVVATERVDSLGDELLDTLALLPTGPVSAEPTVYTRQCAGPVSECIDDMCRNSVERGLCGKWVDEDDSADGLDDEYPPDDEW